MYFLNFTDCPENEWKGLEIAGKEYKFLEKGSKMAGNCSTWLELAERVINGWKWFVG